MASSTFTWPDLVRDVQKFILEMIPEDDLFQFAQTSKQHLELAHGVAFRRGIQSRLQWFKLLAVETMEPGHVHSTSDLILSRKNNRYNDVFAEAARALFMLAKENKQVLIEDEFLSELLKKIDYEREGKHLIERKVAAQMLSVFVTSMTDAQVDRTVNVVLANCEYLNGMIARTDRSLFDLLWLLFLRLSEEQQLELMKLPYIELICIIASPERIDKIFDNYLLPALTTSHGGYLYKNENQMEGFLKLYRLLSAEQQQLVVSCINDHLSSTTKEGRGAYKMMAAIAPIRLKKIIVDGVSKFKRCISESRDIFTQAVGNKEFKGMPIRWTFACQAFEVMASVMMPEDLTDVIPLLTRMLADCSAVENAEFLKDNLIFIYRPVLELLASLVSRMSESDFSLYLQTIHQTLEHQDRAISNCAFVTFAPLLRRATTEQRAPFIPRIIELFQHDLPETECVGDILEAMGEDLSDVQFASIIPGLEVQLEPISLRYKFDREPCESVKAVYTVLIPRLSKEQLLVNANKWSRTCLWLFLRCLELRSEDLDKDILMQFVTLGTCQVLSFGNDPSYSELFYIAQKIIISFTTRQDVLLTRELPWIFEYLNMSFKVETFNVWCHLMSLGCYDLRSFNSALPCDGGLSQLIYLVDEVSNRLSPAPLLQESRSTSLSRPGDYDYAGQRFFRIVSRGAQINPVVAENDEHVCKIEVNQ